MIYSQICYFECLFPYLSFIGSKREIASEMILQTGYLYDMECGIIDLSNGMMHME